MMSPALAAVWGEGVSPESELVRMRRGNPEAFEELLSRYQHRLYRFLVRIVRDRAMAEDLFQQTWVRVVEKSAQFDERRNFEAWLFTIARNLAVDHLRRHRPESLDEPPPGDPAGEPRSALLATGGPSALDRVLQRERSEQIAEALERLPLIYRETLTLRFEEEMKLEEIAKVADVPLSTAKTRLRRGLVWMRQILEKNYAREAQP
jgi:RNA polymerase sigma-70 factor (ECF subfamily)